MTRVPVSWSKTPLAIVAIVAISGSVLGGSDGFAQQAAAPDAGEPLGAAAELRRRGNSEGVASQQRIDAISDDTETLFSRYSNALRQIDSIRIYNKQMRDLITSQEEELDSLTGQLDRVEVVGRSVTPLMLRMINALDAFVQLDMPFLLTERTARVTSLRETMGRADVTNAEKYRHIMEAYQIENEYGRTIEAYRSTIKRGDREDKVDFLRFGRIALVFQTLDGSEAGVWDQNTHEWVDLDASYRTSIREGLRMARKQAAPDLIRLPLPAPTAEQS